jgi:hypothetical protein
MYMFKPHREGERRSSTKHTQTLKMVARISALASVAGLVSAVLAGTPQTCTSNLPLSCHNSTAVSNTCCFVAAGQLLQTQFWDTDPATGPSSMHEPTSHIIVDYLNLSI